ncbi:MAG: 50S ribosomal protein L32 [Synergistaceae bacterium]|jgi:large subunit ribosomal protein L32|nr:50S ribosomal protein L32 [Synergistaceae bacterium]
MATPKRRVSHSRTNKRKAQWLGALEEPTLTTCTHCGETVQTYRACSACGYYKGKQVVKISEKNDTENE